MVREKNICSRNGPVKAHRCSKKVARLKPNSKWAHTLAQRMEDLEMSEGVQIENDMAMSLSYGWITTQDKSQMKKKKRTKYLLPNGIVDGRGFSPTKLGRSGISRESHFTRVMLLWEEIEKRMRRHQPEIFTIGDQDLTTTAYVSIMFYFTSDFRAFAPDPIGHIRKQVKFANQVMSFNDIPVKFRIFCIEELMEFDESPDANKRIKDFIISKPNSMALLNSADMGILMCGTAANQEGDGAVYGLACQGIQPPIAWVFPKDPLILSHEIGHLFGCHHNREMEGGGERDQFYYGYVIKKSMMTTIMANTNDACNTEIPFISRKDKEVLIYECPHVRTKEDKIINIENNNSIRCHFLLPDSAKGLPENWKHIRVQIGDSQNDNWNQTMRLRFVMSHIGDKSFNCGHHSDSCERNCLLDCCEFKDKARECGLAEMQTNLCWSFTRNEFISYQDIVEVVGTESSERDR